MGYNVIFFLFFFIRYFLRVLSELCTFLKCIVGLAGQLRRGLCCGAERSSVRIVLSECCVFLKGVVGLAGQQRPHCSARDEEQSLARRGVLGI
ncbi:hypothetical protein E2C01_083934 [Portunus trituberculatus]|uniref:Uncharacterized protein n=1 Tax=Portunus trituberculatus TaxID=210409 RepID=A0A5B7J4Y8_PORTR|nr:hypothetical protein [Portunus trituberculatus]